MSYNPFDLSPKNIKDVLLNNISIDVDKLAKSPDSINLQTNSSDTLSIENKSPLLNSNLESTETNQSTPVAEKNTNNIFLIIIFIFLIVIFIFLIIFYYNYTNDSEKEQVNESEMTEIQKIEIKTKKFYDYIKSIFLTYQKD